MDHEKPTAEGNVTRDIIVLGASAGGVEALTRLVSFLPPDLPAAVFVVIHIPAHVTSFLPRIFMRAGPIPASHPKDGEPIQKGRIYIAPPNYHLLLQNGSIRLSTGPTENGHRPAVDPLFRSAALECGPRVAGVVLSGSLDDGTAGLAEIRARGGVTIVQSPEEALYPSMPRSAIDHVAVDHVLPIAAIAPLLSRLAREHVPVEPDSDAAPSPTLREEVHAAELRPGDPHANNHPGVPSEYACPACGGALWEMKNGDLVRFRCRTGHAWSTEALLAEQADATETALWTGLRALEERASLLLRLVVRMRRSGNDHSAATFARQVEEAQRSAEVLRGMLQTGKAGQVSDVDPSGRATPPPSFTEESERDVDAN